MIPENEMTDEQKDQFEAQKIADALKTQGNEYYKEKDYYSALDYYQ